MTKYRSDFKRPWSVMPMRCFVNRELNDSDLRVLGALCAFTNQHGVCWPSNETLMELTALKSRTSIHRSVQKLKKLKYVRQLSPKDCQETASGWKSNRYQVLWDKDDPLPTYEDIHIAAPLQVRDEDELDANVIGGMGDGHSLSHTPHQPSAGSALLTKNQLTSDEICNAYIRAVQQATGQVRLYDNEIAHARRLAAAGFTADDVRAATLNTCDAAIERRAGVPSLYDVAGGML
jgi:hypothetical protein